MASLCSEKKKICLHPTKLPLNCYNITVFDMCRPDNRAFRTSLFLSVSPCKIIGTINFDNAREQRYPAKNNHLDYSFSWRIFFFYSVLSLPFHGNGNNFLFSVSLEASFSHSLEKCGAVVFFFSCLLLQC